MDLVPVSPRRPLWSDRQMIAASDLVAEQSWQDAQLARLRRYALGWGVVAGFEVAVDLAGAVVISPGYAVTPLGHEAYLGESLTWANVKDDLLAVCVPGFSANCEDPTGKGDTFTESNFDAWLVVRPDLLQSCPRPLRAEGCGNPGNDWAFSRQSGALRFEIVCALEAGLLPDARPCAEVQALFSSGVVPLPPDIPDMVPLAHVSFTIFGITGVTVSERRRLLPLSEVQAALACCDCTKDVAPPPVEPPKPDPVWLDPVKHRFNELFDDFGGFFPDPKRDPGRLVSSLFPSARGVTLPRVGNFVRDPLQAFAAAGLVTSANELKLWQSGDDQAIYVAAVKKLLGRLPGDVRGVENPYTLKWLFDHSPNFADFRTTFGDQAVADRDEVVRKASVSARSKPGALAVLLFVQLRLDQMLQG